MTILDIYKSQNALQIDLEPDYNDISLLQELNFFTFTTRFLWSNRYRNLRYETEQAFKQGMLIWYKKACEYEADYKKALLAINVLDDQKAGIVRKQNTDGTNQSTSETNNKSTSEVASNPSIDQVQPFDNLPYAQQQNRAKSEAIIETNATTGNNSTTEISGVELIREKLQIEFNNIIRKFNSNMDFIFSSI